LKEDIENHSHSHPVETWRLTERVKNQKARDRRRRRRSAATIGVAIGAILGAAVAVASGYASASDAAATIKFENHHWTPLNVTVPANQTLTLEVINASNETIEFESFKLNRETAMTPGQTIKVPLPALNPGSYDFYDDFHQDVPEGTIVAK
jgi:plastocyanin